MPRPWLPQSSLPLSILKPKCQDLGPRMLALGCVRLAWLVLVPVLLLSPLLWLFNVFLDRKHVRAPDEATVPGVSSGLISFYRFTSP